MVTPLAGVWIEMFMGFAAGLEITSLPLRECGLKFCELSRFSERYASLPLRECGLKYIRQSPLQSHILSLPLRECGLK